MHNGQDNAAHALTGRTLKNRWQVLRKIEPREGATGGFFSVCYIVSDGTQDAFLKALNFQAFFQMHPGESLVEIIRKQTAAFEYERSLSLRCKSKRFSKVSTILDEGQEEVENFTIPTVPYLIFEMADGDARSHINFSKDIEIAWKIKSLHDVAVGLRQLHSTSIGHQDLKPSNVLLYDRAAISKVGDLGRSLCADIEAPHDNGNDFPGDFNYAPPEFLYKYYEPEWNLRVRATDMYLFGSLITFYFIGANMTALIAKNMDRQFSWHVFTGSYEEVQDYLVDAFYKALEEFCSSITNEKLAAELSRIVEYCCFPIPSKRGHPKTLKNSTDRHGNRVAHLNQYDFTRTVSELDLLEKRLRLYFK